MSPALPRLSIKLRLATEDRQQTSIDVNVDVELLHFTIKRWRKVASVIHQNKVSAPLLSIFWAIISLYENSRPLSFAWFLHHWRESDLNREKFCRRLTVKEHLHINGCANSLKKRGGEGGWISTETFGVRDGETNHVWGIILWAHPCRKTAQLRWVIQSRNVAYTSHQVHEMWATKSHFKSSWLEKLICM